MYLRLQLNYERPIFTAFIKKKKNYSVFAHKQIATRRTGNVRRVAASAGAACIQARVRQSFTRQPRRGVRLLSAARMRFRVGQLI